MNHVTTTDGKGSLRRLRARAADDRRRFQRFEGSGLMATIDTSLRPVDDVSISGLRVSGAILPTGAYIRIQLIPRRADKLVINDAVWADAVVVGTSGGYARLRFSSITLKLAKLIVRHISERSGIEPFMLR